MQDLHESAEEAHELLGNLLILLLILHVGAALKHHFWNRDDVLRRMLPFAR
jgi:cytochrome b561